MPLIDSSSNAAREANIKTEIAAGRDPRQAEAIGYSNQRRGRRKMTLSQAKKRRRKKAD